MSNESFDLDTTDKNINNNLQQNYQVEIGRFDETQSNRDYLSLKDRQSGKDRLSNKDVISGSYNPTGKEYQSSKDVQSGKGYQSVKNNESIKDYQLNEDDESAQEKKSNKESIKTDEQIENKKSFKKMVTKAVESESPIKRRYKSRDFDEEEVDTEMKRKLDNADEDYDMAVKLKKFFRKSPTKKSDENIDSPGKEDDIYNGNFFEKMKNKLGKTIKIPQDENLDNLMLSPSKLNKKKINKIRLVRTKIEGEDELKHEIYIQGDVDFDGTASLRTKRGDRKYKEQYIPINNFDSNNFPYSKNELKSGSIELSLFKHCEFFSKLFKLSSLLLKQFNTYLNNVDIHSLILFCLYDKIKGYDFSHKGIQIEIISSLIKSIQIETVLEIIPKYIEFLIAEFNRPIIQEFSENYLEDISIDKQYANILKNFSIYNDLTCIVNKFFNFFFLKWRTNLMNKLETDEEFELNHLQTNMFYCLLIKIEHYFINFFPYCCGNDDDDLLIYIKSPFAFCMDCKIIICVNCFKFHKLHNYFDFASFKKYKDSNIYSPKEMFLNYQNMHGHVNFGERDVDPKFDDLIMNTILNKFKSKIAKFFENGQEHPDYLKDKKFFTVFDFLEIFLLEHVFKMVFPFCVENYNDLSGKVEFNQTKQKISEDTKFIKGITHCLKKISETLNKEVPLKKQNYNFEKMDLNDFYLVAMEEYEEHKMLSELDKKNTRFLIENLFYNKLSIEMRVSKSLIMSSNALNYEVSSSNLGAIISQVNSPKQYSFRFFDNRFEIEKLRKKQIEAKIENKLIGYKKFISGVAGTSKVDEFLLRSSNKFNIKKLMRDSYKKDSIFKGGNIETKTTKTACKKFTKNFFRYDSAMKNLSGREMFNMEKMLKEALNSKNDLSHILKHNKDLLTVDYSEASKFERYKYKCGFGSKYSIICIYISDLLYKLSNFGVIKYIEKEKN